MPPFTPEELEPGSERVARLFGAAAWSGVAGYVLANTAMYDTPYAFALVLPSIGPISTILLSLPRCAIGSYVGRGLAATTAFALGTAFGVDPARVDPWVETTPGLAFVVMLFLGWLWLLAGLVALTVVKLVLRAGNRES